MGSSRNDGCPSEEVLHAFARRSLAGDAAGAVERHATTCTVCTGALAALARAATISASDGATTATSAAPSGRQIGRYSVIRLLGEGGMGAVYLAHDSQLDRRVALKLMHASTSADARARMAREARLMARFVHPNIVTVYDAGEADGQMYIVMEFVAGKTLAAWLEAEPRSVDAILGVFRAAGAALAEAHAAGVAHRDFKPENVLLDDNGRIAVSDFGIASETLTPTDSGSVPLLPAEIPNAAGTRSLTRTGTLMGTPAYMSPEQFLGQPAGPASDQFSFAVALFEALFKQPPFPATTLNELRRAVLRGELAPLPDQIRAAVSPAIMRALVRGLAREPSGRFPDIRAFLAALEPPRTASRRPRLLYALLAIGIAVVSGGGMLVWQRHAADQAARKLAEEQRRADETAHRLARETLHRPCRQLVADTVVHDCIDVPVSGNPPHLYFAVDNSLSMVDHKEDEKNLVLALTERLGIRAEYGLSLFPAKGALACEPGGETLGAVVGGYTPLRAKDHHVDLVRDLGAAPSGFTAASATLHALATMFGKRKDKAKIAIVLVTDGGVTCGATPACDAHSCTRNIESQSANGQSCKPDGPSCCTKSDATSFCLDDAGTTAAITALAAEGIHTWIVGVKPLDRYKDVLDGFAVASGTRRQGAVGWYDSDSALNDLTIDLRHTLMPTTPSCTHDLPSALDRPDAAVVLFDGELAPAGSKVEKKRLTLTGTACERMQSGHVGWIRIVSE